MQVIIDNFVYICQFPMERKILPLNLNGIHLMTKVTSFLPSYADKNGTTEIVIENHKILSETMMLTTMSNYVDDSNVEKGRYVKNQLLYGNVIELDNISKVNINGEQIDLD